MLQCKTTHGIVQVSDGPMLATGDGVQETGKTHPILEKEVTEMEDGVAVTEEVCVVTPSCDG